MEWRNSIILYVQYIVAAAVVAAAEYWINYYRVYLEKKKRLWMHIHDIITV